MNPAMPCDHRVIVAWIGRVFQSFPNMPTLEYKGLPRRVLRSTGYISKAQGNGINIHVRQGGAQGQTGRDGRQSRAPRASSGRPGGRR